MCVDPWFAESPRWACAIFDEFTRLNDLGTLARRDTYRALFSFVLCLEIEEFPRARCEVVTPTLLRLTWTDGRKTMRLEAGPHHINITTSHPDPAGMPPGRGQLVNAARKTFEWYHPARATQIRRDEP